MKYNYKKITTYALGIIMLFSLMVSSVQAQEMWYLRSGKLRPNVSTWGLQVPSLNNSGTKCLQVNASGVISAAASACGSGGGGTADIDVGTTAVLNGTTTRILYDNAGVVGQYAISGTGNVAMTTSPTFTTPILGTPTSVTLTNATGLPISTGLSGLGTGVATALGINTGSAGAVLLFNGALGTPSSGTLTNATGLPISTGVSGLATGIATFLGTPSSANLATAVTNETGSGGLVFATSPTLVTPILGTPTSVTLTNGTGLPISTGLTGAGTGVLTALGVNVGSAGAFVVNGGALGTPSSGTLTNATGLPVSTGLSGLGSGVATFLATPSSANLATAITDETGSGALVFGTSPTLTTPTIAKLANLTSNGFVKTSGGDGTLSIDTNTYLTGNQSITLSGDVSGSGTTAITTTIGADKILESMLKAVDSPADEECLTYEATGGDFEWQTCGGGGGGSSVFSDLTAATGTNTIDNTNYAQQWNWSTLTTQKGLTLTGDALTTGTIQEITSTSTAATTAATYSGSYKGLGINLSGINGTSGAYTYGLYVLNAKTGTSSNNIAAHFDTTNAGGNLLNLPLMLTTHDGTGLKVGSRASGEMNFWLKSVTPSTTNYTLGLTATTTAFNGTLQIRNGASNIGGWNSTGISIDANNNLSTGGQRLMVRFDPTASANYGVISLGNQGNWNAGGTTPFAGSASGTAFATNFASSFAGNFIDMQAAGVSKFRIESSGLAEFESTITAGGTTGNQTINKPTGTVNIAATGTSVTVTNSVVSASSIVLTQTRTNDATCSVKNAVPSAGSVVITMTAACTAETSVGFVVINN